MSTESNFGQTTAVSNPPVPVHQAPLPIEFMDACGKYVFRAYLGDAPPDEHAEDIVANALANIIVSGGTLSNGQLYDELHAKLCGPEPMERGPMLNFLRLCAQAIRIQLEQRAKSALKKSNSQEGDERPTFAMGAPTSLYLAEQFPDPVLARLRIWKQFTESHPNAGLVYELADFVGCTDAEISQLLQMTPKRVKDLRVQALSDVWEHDPE